AGVVRRDGHVVCFRKGRDLLELADAASPGHVGHDVVGELLFEDRHELPARVQPLTHGNRRTHALAHLLEGVIALDRNRLLEPVDLPGVLQRTAEPDGGRHVEAAMGIDQELDFGPGDLTDQGGEFGCFTLPLLGKIAIEIAVLKADATFIVRKGIELDPGVTRIDDRPNLLDHPFPRSEFALIRMRIDQDVISHPAAQQFIDGQVTHLADNVPERDIDAAYDMRGGAARTEVSERAKDLVPGCLDLRRIVSDQEFIELPQDCRDGAIGNFGGGRDLAPARNALVGLHFDEKKLAPVGGLRLNQPRNNRGYFHNSLLEPLTSDRRCGYAGWRNASDSQGTTHETFTCSLP